MNVQTFEWMTAYEDEIVKYNEHSMDDDMEYGVGNGKGMMTMDDLTMEVDIELRLMFVVHSENDSIHQ